MTSCRGGPADRLKSPRTSEQTGRRGDCSVAPMTSAIFGSLAGTIVGDALGLPYEGLSPRRAAKLLGPPDRHRFLLGHGMVSDDSEHAVLTARALALSGADPAEFSRIFGWQLRFWIASLPAATGWATLRACVRLWLGWSPRKSGVFSAGNGPLMRAPVLGAACSTLDRLEQLVTVSTRATHSDPKATRAALAVALAARQSADHDFEPNVYLKRLATLIDERDELFERIRLAVELVRIGEPTTTLAADLGLSKGVTGYSYDTAPICVHAWLSHPRDFRAALLATIACGGDADTTAAITGGIAGAACGIQGIPSDWTSRIWEWPWSFGTVESLSAAVRRAMDSGHPMAPPPLAFWRRIPRNLLFTFWVLKHGFRRLLPPY